MPSLNFWVQEAKMFKLRGSVLGLCSIYYTPLFHKVQKNGERSVFDGVGCQ